MSSATTTTSGAESGDDTVVPEGTPAAAGTVFGDRLPLAERFVHLLTTMGVDRGVIGPNEPARIWTRHVLNCAVITEAVPPAARVVDVGSGAGLPGVAMAIRRPDVRVDLVEPMQRRVAFLGIVIAELGLTEQIRVVRGRAEDARVRAQVGDADVVTARAVAALDRLVAWCVPLVADSGRLVLMKGADAQTEVVRTRSVLRRSGAADVTVTSYGQGLLEVPTTVVEIVPAPRPRRRPPGPSRR